MTRTGATYEKTECIDFSESGEAGMDFFFFVLCTGGYDLLLLFFRIHLYTPPTARCRTPTTDAHAVSMGYGLHTKPALLAGGYKNLGAVGAIHHTIILFYNTPVPQLSTSRSDLRPHDVARLSSFVPDTRGGHKPQQRPWKEATKAAS